MEFQSFNLKEPVFEGVSAMGYAQATPVQTQAIPLILEGKDLIACAQTGTGKTAAYLIPLLDRLSGADENHHIQSLILAPTRELAKQIDEQIQGLGYFSGVNSIAVYGGSTGGDVWSQQKKALEQGADVVISTPGRLIAHLRMGYVNLSHVKFLILDEADKMLDMGFLGDIMEIVNTIPTQRQTLLFSATMPPKIRTLAAKILNEPEQVNLAVSKPAEGIDQRLYLAYDEQKMPLLEHLIKNMEVQSMIIFTSRKSNVNIIVRSLQRMKFAAHGIQSDLEQNEREKLLLDFRNKKFNILVATDILSRGIDIDSISHVVNYDMPHDAEDYIHRIGRTARANTTGTAISFINEKDIRKVQIIERLLEKEVPKLPLPESLGKGPSLRGASRGAAYGTDKPRPTGKPKAEAKPATDVTENQAPRKKKRKPFKKKNTNKHAGETQPANPAPQS